MALKRIVMHWSAGTHDVNATDRQHYHEIVDGSGLRVAGDLLPEANNSTLDGVYAAHTRKFNTGAIGLSMAAMEGAKEKPFNPGNFPIKKKQLEVFLSMVAEYCDTYDITISRENVLSHAEVQITHKVMQNGKWDITWLPGMDKPEDPIAVGDLLRDRILKVQKAIF